MKNDLLKQLGECWRGDWSEFDGRTLRDQLDDWLTMDNTSRAVKIYRKSWGMCPLGEGHWTEYCSHEKNSQ